MNIILAAVPWSGMKNSYPPLGMGYLASYLRQDNMHSHRITVMDFGLAPGMTAEKAVEQILDHAPPDILGLSCLTNNFQDSVRVACMAKKKHPSLRTVLGGPHPSVDPASAAACSGVDAVVYGEGEKTLLELVNNASEGGWAEGVDGCAYSIENRVQLNPPRALIEDLDTLPFPARDLMEIDKYELRADDGDRVYTLLTSRGCPYSCAYCYKGVFGKQYRVRSAESVLSEIRSLVRSYDARHLYFGDDIFMLEEKRVRALCEGILRMDPGLSWSCLARVDTVSPDLLAVMKRAGCSQIHYGIESGSPEILDRINKKIDLDAVERAVAWTRDAGIRSKGYFMAGLPGDTEETLNKTLTFAGRLRLDEVMFSLATPFPGTKLWDELAKKSKAPDADDFQNAFYFDDGAGGVRAFFNLSDIKDERLEYMVRKAQAHFRKRKELGAFKRRFGPLAGLPAYLVYRLMSCLRSVERTG